MHHTHRRLWTLEEILGTLGIFMGPAGHEWENSLQGWSAATMSLSDRGFVIVLPSGALVELLEEGGRLFIDWLAGDYKSWPVQDSRNHRANMLYRTVVDQLLAL